MLCELKRHPETGVLFYLPYYAQALTQRHKTVPDRRILDFKLYGLHQALVVALIGRAAAHFEATAVAVCGGGMEPTRIEEAVRQVPGAAIVFEASQERAKRHDGHRPTPESERARLAIRQPAEPLRRVLLVDDICTMGRSLSVYEELLRPHVAGEIVKLALAHANGDIACEVVASFEVEVPEILGADQGRDQGRDGLLVELLAWQDAIWAPLRAWWPGRRVTAMYEARRDFPKIGVRWVAGGSAQHRKATERTLAALAETGAVALFKAAVRTGGAKLTDQGEATARAVAGLPSLSDSFAVMCELEQAGGAAWEAALAGIEWADTERREPRQRLVTLEEILLPALARRWVESRSTVCGHVRYELTPDGREALAGGAPTQGADEYEPTPEAAARYCATFRHAEGLLATRTPQVPGEIGMIPLPLCEAGALSAD